MRGKFVRWACICAVLLLFLGPATAASAAAAGRPFVAPVDAEIARHFEAPSHKFGPGHRGIDYEVPSGTTVRASGEGTVSFAGPVAADGLFITIEHLGGISTTYSYLSRVDAKQGDKVTQGQVIGLSGEGHPGGPAVLHFGAKRDGDYIDPDLLLQEFDDITDILQLTPTGEKKSAGRFSGSSGDPADFTAEHAFTGPGADLTQEADTPTGSAVNPLRSPKLQFGEPERGGGVRPAASFEIPVESRPLGFEPLHSDSSQLFSNPTEPRLVKDSTNNPTLDPRLSGVFPGVKEAPNRKSEIGFKEQIARWADGIGEFNLKFADEPILALFAPPVGGAFKEAACWLRGGGKAPVFYPETELQRGFRYGQPSNREARKPPPNDHVVIAVAGITTQTQAPDGMSALYQDSWWEDLGYGKDDVYFFSYKGQPKGTRAARSKSFEFHEPYSREDTYQPIEESALKLSQQIRSIQNAHPGRKIDIVAHSQGGAIAQYYLANLYRPDRVPLSNQKASPSVVNFVSISSPHLGTPGAAGYAILADSWHGRKTYRGIEKTAEQVGLPKGSANSSMQLNPDSDFIKDAVRDWDAKNVNAFTITTPMDIAVVPKYTRLAGAQHYTVWIDLFDAKPWGHHSTVVGMPETKAIVYNALRGTPSRCTGFMNAIADEVTGDAIARSESGLLRAVDLFMNFPWH